MSKMLLISILILVILGIAFFILRRPPSGRKCFT